MRRYKTFWPTLLLLCLPVLASGQTGPTGTPTIIDEALAAAQQGRVDDAIASLEQARGQTGDEPRLLAILGGLYLETGRAAEALEILAPLTEAADVNPAVLYNAGRAAATIGQLDQATAFLERSLVALPTSPAARELGFLRLAQGEVTEAYLVLRPWSRLHPEDTSALFAAVSSAVALGRPGEAEEMIAGLPSDDPRTQLLWGKTLLLNGDGWGALAIVRPLAEEPPEGLEAQVRSVLAGAYLAIEQPDSAVEELEGKVEGDPDLALLLSQAYQRRGEPARALAVLEPIAQMALEQLGAESPEADRWLGGEVALEYGRLLAAAERFDEAIPFLELATQLAPEDAAGLEALGEALVATGRPEEGQQALSRAENLAAGPGEASGIALGRSEGDPTEEKLRQALSLAARGQREEALRLVRQEQLLVLGDVRPILLESRLLSELGRTQEALEVAEEAVQTAPDNADAYYLRGVLRLNLDQRDTAEQDLRRAIELSPQHTAALNDLAVLLMVRGDREEARTLLERVLALRPDDPVAAQNLERLEE